LSLRTLARASALYTAGNIAPKIGAFFLLPIYVRFLSKAEYGEVALLTTLSGLLGLLVPLGVDAALMRLHFDLQGRGRATLYSTLTLFTLGTSAGTTLLVAAIAGPFFPRLFAGIPFFPLGALTLLIAFTGGIDFVPSVLFRATSQPGRFISYNLTSFVLGSAASVTLLVVVGMGPVGVLLGQLVGTLVPFVLTVVIVRRLGGWTFSRSSLAAALRFGLPLVPHSLAAWALRLSDRWLIGLLIGLPVLAAQAAIGVYSFGYQIGYVITIIVVSFNSAWSPYFYRVGQEPYGPRLFRQITTLVMAGLLAMAVGLAALAPEVVTVMAGSRYAQSVDVLRVVAFASVLQGLYTMLVTVVFLTKRTRRLAILTVSSAILNVGLNLVLIPRIGIMGAAWSTIAAYAFFAAATWWYARRWYPLHLDYARLAALAALAAVAMVLATLTVLPADPVLQGALHFGIGAAFALAAAAIGLRPLLSLRGLTAPHAARGEPA
jgi:O-antigen/teichoic acid export membrane protein